MTETGKKKTKIQKKGTAATPKKKPTKPKPLTLDKSKDKSTKTETTTTNDDSSTETDTNDISTAVSFSVITYLIDDTFHFSQLKPMARHQRRVKEVLPLFRS